MAKFIEFEHFSDDKVSVNVDLIQFVLKDDANDTMTRIYFISGESLGHVLVHEEYSQVMAKILAP